MSVVKCQASGVIIYGEGDKDMELVGEGSVSTGPTPSSCNAVKHTWIVPPCIIQPFAILHFTCNVPQSNLKVVVKFKVERMFVFGFFPICLSHGKNNSFLFL